MRDVLCRTGAQLENGGSGQKETDPAATRVAEILSAKHKRLLTEREAMLAEVVQFKQRISTMQAKHAEELNRANARPKFSTAEIEVRRSSLCNVAMISTAHQSKYITGMPSPAGKARGL